MTLYQLKRRKNYNKLITFIEKNNNFWYTYTEKIENKIKHIANKTIIMTGTNDIVDKSLNFEDILNNINRLIESLLKINKNTKIYFIEIPSIAFRMDRNKEEIFRLNEYLKNNLDRRIKYIEVNEDMTDDFKNLKLEYTYDGLHFNEEGYKILEKILEKEI